MVHLDVRLTCAATGFVNAQLAQNLARFERRCHEIKKKIIDVDRALAILAGHDKFGVERNYRCGPVTGRIRVGHAAADRALVADLHVANVSGALRQQRTDLLEQLRRFDLIMGGHRPDAYLVTLFANVREICDAADIDEQRRRRQPQLHRRDQAMPTGENFRVFVLRQQG